MNPSHGLPINKPVSVWNKEIRVDFKKLFNTLGKAIVGTKTGSIDSVIKSVFDSIDSFKFEKDASQLTWLLIYRAILDAVARLVKDNLFLIQEANRGYRSLAGETELSDENLQEIADKLEYEVEAKNLGIEQSFFENPKGLSIINEIKKPFAEWLENFGLDSSQASSISERFPSYFVFALNEEWRKRSDDYEPIKTSFDTPFTKAAQKEQEWNRYYAWLQKTVDESMFQEAFGLRQIYVPLRAYYEEKIKQEKLVAQDEKESPKEKENETTVINKIVIKLEDELEIWVNNSDKNDGIRIISGGPGYGKSSLAKMFASKMTGNNKIRILFVPLHLFELTEDLSEAIENFLKQQDFITFNPLNDLTDTKLLLIFDGLDELSMQGRIGAEIAQLFVINIQNKVNLANYSELRLKVLILGRELSIQSSVNNYDKSIKILHLLPYYLSKEDREKYIDSNNLLSIDQRNEWWNRYGKVTGKNYDKLPVQLNRENLRELNSLPLLNYLLAVSFNREGIKFDQTTNLNSIYENLLVSVYERRNKWAEQQHPVLTNISQENFFRILEEIALATWHGNGRKVTVKEIEAQCEIGRLTNLLEKFQEKAKKGVADLLVAFYFRKSGGHDVDGSETFEFTHKSFGEYLTAKRLVRGIKKIYLETEKNEASYDEGWTETESLKHWVELSGKAAMDVYLLDFVRREIAISDRDLYGKWQVSLSKLINFILRYGIPMEKFGPRLNLKEELRQSRNAAESLLAVTNACCLVNRHPVILDFPDVFAFGKLIAQIQENALFENNIIYRILSNFDLSGCMLKFANFRGFDLHETIFEEADLTEANLTGANLRESNLSGANLSGANLTNANLTEATINEADFNEAIIVNTNFIGVDIYEAYNLDLFEGEDDEDDEDDDINFQTGDFRGKDFSDADLVSCNFERADFYLANLRNANFENADFRGANLDGAIGIKKSEE